MTFDPERSAMPSIQPGGAPRTTTEPQLPPSDPPSKAEPQPYPARPATPVRWQASPCPKCQSRDARTIFHNGGPTEYGPEFKRRCAPADQQSIDGEHLHVYCQICHYDWVEPTVRP